jgi:hypothetical protein
VETGAYYGPTISNKVIPPVKSEDDDRLDRGIPFRVTQGPFEWGSRYPGQARIDFVITAVLCCALPVLTTCQME